MTVQEGSSDALHDNRKTLDGQLNRLYPWLVSRPSQSAMPVDVTVYFSLCQAPAAGMQREPLGPS